MTRTAEPHWPGVSALVVAVPALERWVRDRTAHYDQAYLSADPSFAHAHVTLLSPFVPPSGLTPGVCARVGAVLGRLSPFTVRFERVGVFPDGVVYLEPEPDAVFREATAALVEAFPEFPPYEGRFADPTPHLTLDWVPPGVDVGPFVDDVRASVASGLPAFARIDEARLSWYEQDACRTLARWPFGQSATRVSPAGRGRRLPQRVDGPGSRRTRAW